MASLRRNAPRLVFLATLAFVNQCLQAAEADALAITANIEAKHLPFGTIVDPMYASTTSDQITGYTRCGDSALWTGHYLAAEAFRYKVTAAADALANVKQMVAGIQSLIDVTGSDVLARCQFPANSPYTAGIESEEASNGVYTSTSVSGAVWIGNTSRDEYCGVMFGLSVAYDLVNDGGVQTSISQIVTRIMNFLKSHAWTVVMPDGSISTTFVIRPDEQSTFDQIANRINPSQFSPADPTILVLPPILVDVATDDSYFKFNLDSINFYNLIRLSGPYVPPNFSAAYQALRNHTAPQQNAFFDIIDRSINGANSTRDAETLALLDAWLVRPQRDPTFDWSSQVSVCSSQACTPLPIPMRIPTDFIWQRTPYQPSGGGQNTIETAGIDYILPYWMARYYAVAAPLAVDSSAAARAPVAPQSLASIYGLNLAPAAEPATTIPLPLSLQGVTVNLKDAQGVLRQAPLVYISPTQINFEVPEDTAQGMAIITAQNGNATQTSQATVETVAPSLFTIDGTGTGIAAATAIMADSSGNQTPVPVFICEGVGCVGVPLDVSSGGVYLSLFGTGLRNVSSLTGATTTATVNGIAVLVTFAGAQPSFEGLDQVNVNLPASLAGSGVVSIVVTANQQTTNAVTIQIE